MKNNTVTAQSHTAPRGLNLKVLSMVAALTFAFGGYLVYSNTRLISQPYDLNPSAKATYDGRESQAKLYQNPNAPLLLVMPEENLAYRIFPDKKRIFWSSMNSVTVSQGKAWDNNTDPDVPGVDLGYSNGVKIRSIKPDTNSRLYISADRIEFNGLEAKPITIQIQQPENKLH
jgi:hypothetical protein